MTVVAALRSLRHPAPKGLTRPARPRTSSGSSGCVGLNRICCFTSSRFNRPSTSRAFGVSRGLARCRFNQLSANRMCQSIAGGKRPTARAATLNQKAQRIALTATWQKIMLALDETKGLAPPKMRQSRQVSVRQFRGRRWRPNIPQAGFARHGANPLNPRRAGRAAGVQNTIQMPWRRLYGARRRCLGAMPAICLRRVEWPLEALSSRPPLPAAPIRNHGGQVQALFQVEAGERRCVHPTFLPASWQTSPLRPQISPDCL